MIKVILTIGMIVKIVRETSNLARLIIFFNEQPFELLENREENEIVKAMMRRGKIKMLGESIFSCVLLLAVFVWMANN